MKSAIPTIALTATATCDTRKRIADSLGLRNFVLIKESPEKPNIKHIVYHTKTRDIDDMFQWLVKELREEGVNASKTIIYCQSRKVVTEIYESFITQLPQSFRKHVNMFHATTPNDVQENIIANFSGPDGELRVLIATIAYGMGVDVRGVNRAVICGQPSDLDDYVQMSGRIGRDGTPSIAATIKYPGCSVGRSTTSGMRDFLKGDRCRREIVLEHFGETKNTHVAKHSCCDVCAVTCLCSEGKCQGRSEFENKLSKALISSNSLCSEELSLNIPTAKSVDKLCMALEEYRLSLLSADPEHLYCGADLSCGFSKEVAAKIIIDCNVQFTFDMFVSRYNFPSQQLALDVWNIVESTLERSFTSADQQASVSTDSELDSDTEEEEMDDEYGKPTVISDSDTD